MAQEVVPNLFVGDYPDALRFEGETLCVLEGAREAHPHATHWLPVLQGEPGKDFYASPARLDEISVLITERLQAGVRLLVHCGAGIERAPLVVAWWLVRTGRHVDLATAYQHLMGVRPQVQSRQAWVREGG